MKKLNKDVYSHSKASGICANTAKIMRSRMYKIFESLVDINALNRVIDVGVTADRQRADSNFFEYAFPFKDKLVAFSNQDAKWLEKEFDGLQFIQGDGCNMPFEDGSFDLVFSSAVIEHVGSKQNQKRFILECCRVSKKYVFITTPNRWHPIEFHTVLPLIHWLPKKIHRFLLRCLGFKDLSKESELNLLSHNDLLTLVDFPTKIKEIKHVNFMFFKSNLLLFIEKC